MSHNAMLQYYTKSCHVMSLLDIPYDTPHNAYLMYYTDNIRVTVTLLLINHSLWPIYD